MFDLVADELRDAIASSSSKLKEAEEKLARAPPRQWLDEALQTFGEAQVKEPLEELMSSSRKWYWH